MIVLLALVVSSARAAPTALEVNANSTNAQIVYGDLLLTPRQKARVEAAARGSAVQRALIRDRGSNRWPKNVVPYEISSVYSSYE